MIDDLLKYSVTIRRKSINPTTRQDIVTTIATVNALVQPIANASQISPSNEIGKEYIIFFADGTDVLVGDLITYNSVNFKIDSIQERNSLNTNNKFYSTRATKQDTNSLYP